jgi:hypothetical protein
MKICNIYKKYIDLISKKYQVDFTEYRMDFFFPELYREIQIKIQEYSNKENIQTYSVIESAYKYQIRFDLLKKVKKQLKNRF